MNKPLYFLFFIYLFLSSCGTETVSKRPVVLIDIEDYTSNGLEAYNNAEWTKALHFFNKALLLYQGIDDQEGILLSNINLAEASLAMHDLAKCTQFLVIASNIASYDLYQHYYPRISLLNALVAIQKNQLHEAENILSKILPLFNVDIAISMPNAIQMAAIASQTKIAFFKKQDEALWVRRYANALELTENKQTSNLAQLLRFQAVLLLQQELENKAESNMLQALVLYKENLSRGGIAVTLFELGQFYKSHQRWQEAEDYLNRSKAVYGFLGNNEKEMQIIQLLVQVEQRSKATSNK